MIIWRGDEVSFLLTRLMRHEVKIPSVTERTKIVLEIGQRKFEVLDRENVGRMKLHTL